MPVIKLKPHGKKLRQRFRVPEEVVGLFGREFIHFSTPKQDRIAAEAECAEWLAAHWAEFARLQQAPSGIQAVLSSYLKDVPEGEALSEKAREGE
ncbi:MAG: hypothetical protein H6R19_3311 [Proteobacteria bacterium]|nr:hypothetical protein [Pseudomonadota bacterium]